MRVALLVHGELFDSSVDIWKRSFGWLARTKPLFSCRGLKKVRTLVISAYVVGGKRSYLYSWLWKCRRKGKKRKNSRKDWVELVFVLIPSLISYTYRIRKTHTRHLISSQQHQSSSLCNIDHGVQHGSTTSRFTRRQHTRWSHLLNLYDGAPRAAHYSMWSYVLSDMYPSSTER